MGYKVIWNDAGHQTRYEAENREAAVAWGEERLAGGIGVVTVSSPEDNTPMPFAEFKRKARSDG